MNVCFRPEGSQPKMAIIFRGQGKRLTEVEKKLWHPDIDVYFQKNAWADTAFCAKWAQHTLKPAAADDGGRPFLLFCDNLEGQTKPAFKDEVIAQKGIPVFGVANATDIWQPVDGGYGATLKRLVNQEFFNWLDDEENCEKWYGEKSKISASEKRILITHWVAAAYKRLTAPKFDGFRYRLFEKTGCLITADGSDDHEINPEGLQDYKVPPPILLDASTYSPKALPPPEITAEDEDRNIFDMLDELDGEEDMENVELLDEDEEIDMEMNEVEENGWVFNYTNF